MAIGLITDQSPNMHEAHYWTTFLNQDTVFMDGAERIAKMMDFPVFYCELRKERRGYCRVDFDLVTDRPKETATGRLPKYLPAGGTDHPERTGLLAMVA